MKTTVMLACVLVVSTLFAADETPKITSIADAGYQMGNFAEPQRQAAGRKYLEDAIANESESDENRLNAGCLLAERALGWKQDFGLALKALKRVTPLARLEKDKARIAIITSKAHVIGKDPTAAISALRGFLDSKDVKDAAARATVTLELATVYRDNGQQKEAVAVLDEAMATLVDQMAPPDASKLVMTMADACIQSGDPDKAAQTLRDGLAKLAKTVPNAGIVFNSYLGDVCLRNQKNTTEAEKAYKTAIENGLLKQGVLDADSANRFVTAYLGLADAYLGSERSSEAVSLLLSALPQCARCSGGPMRISQKLVELKAGKEQLQKAVTELRKVVIKGSSADTAAAQCQQAIIRLLLGIPECRQEALQEARTYFQWCGDADMETVAGLIVEAFKAADQHLGRVNRFLRYQRLGAAGEDGKPGTDDDLADVLREVPPVENAERTAIIEAAIKATPGDWQGLQRQSWLYVCLGQPDKAFDALVQSFDACPPDQKMLQQATDALTAFIIRFTRDKGLAENAVLFLMYGPEGKDGKKGTEDDLKDPWKTIRAKIAGEEPKKAPNKE